MELDGNARGGGDIWGETAPSTPNKRTSAHTVGWSDKKQSLLDHVLLYQIIIINPRFQFEMLLFKLPQGLIVPQKNLTVTPKWVCFFFFQTFLELATGGNVFFNEEKLLKNWFSFDQVKNSFAHFGGLTKNLFGDCS